jgi:DcuC family C4-dicarboxylate transporter
MSVLLATIAVIIIGGICLWRRADIRLVLIGAAVALFAVHAAQPAQAGRRFDAFAQVFFEFATGMSNPKFIVPICSAMGFAYVCKLTGCDAHLVHMLIGPLRHVRWALVPGGIAVSFLVNSAIVSQTSTVSVVGPVLIPLLLAGGYSRAIAGAVLLLGGSMGGELLNPAAVEVLAIRSFTGVDGADVIWTLLPYNLLASGTALLAFWAMSYWLERRQAALAMPANDADVNMNHQAGSIAAMMSKSMADQIERVNVAKALVPLVPIFLLLVVKKLLTKSGLMPPMLITSSTNPIGEQTTIAAAMLLGVICAGLTSPIHAGKLLAAFFEGAGFAFAHIISIITAAAMFAEGVRVNGLIEILTAHLGHAPVAIAAASIVIPWAFACITGTAVGTAPLVIAIILPIASGVSAASTKSTSAIAMSMRIGSVNAIAAQFGRTSSPVAPVTIMCATLARVKPIDLVKLVFPPLLAGGVVLLIAALATSH